MRTYKNENPLPGFSLIVKTIKGETRECILNGDTGLFVLTDTITSQQNEHVMPSSIDVWVYKTPSEKSVIKPAEIKTPKKRTFNFDYISSTYFDNASKTMMGRTASTTIEAYDEEHACLLFEKKFPDKQYDQPYI